MVQPPEIKPGQVWAHCMGPHMKVVSIFDDCVELNVLTAYGWVVPGQTVIETIDDLLSLYTLLDETTKEGARCTACNEFYEYATPAAGWKCQSCKSYEEMVNGKQEKARKEDPEKAC